MRVLLFVISLRSSRELARLIPILCMTLIATSSHACSCSFEQEQGFIHAGSKGEAVLPANARGVLFLVPEPNYLSGESDVYLMSGQFLKTPKQDDFVVTDSSNNKTLKAVVEKVRMHRTPDPGPSSTQHYFVFKNPLDEACYQGGTNARCPKIRHSNGSRPTIADLQKQGKLKEITNVLDRDTGLFRVRPEGGFQEGNSYTIATSATTLTGGAAFSAGRITVRIAPPLKTNAADRYLIELKGTPQVQVISVPMGGSCAANLPAIVQEFAYVVPSVYAPYRESMMFFTERLEEAIRNGTTLPRFVSHATRGSICSQIRMGGSELGIGKERVTSPCETGRLSSPVQIRGRIGFLEMEDELHVTPAVVVDFGRRKGRSCGTF